MHGDFYQSEVFVIWFPNAPENDGQGLETLRYQRIVYLGVNITAAEEFSDSGKQYKLPPPGKDRKLKNFTDFYTGSCYGSLRIRCNTKGVVWNCNHKFAYQFYQSPG